MSLQLIKTEISRIRMDVVLGAYKAFKGSDATNKTDAVQWLSEQCHAGVINIQDIKNSKPVTPVSVDVSAIQSASARAESVALDALGQAKSLSNKIETLTRDVVGMQKKAQAVDTTVKQADVNKQVAKLIDDAFKPFKQAVENAQAETVVAKLSAVHVVDTKPALDVFGVDARDIKGTPMMVDIYNHPDTPAIDPYFVWSAPILKQILLSAITGENTWFGGEKGTGKSETAKQFCARTGRNFVRINFHKHTSAEEYIGSVGLQAGNTVFEPKDFLIGYSTPSTVILLDELTNADAGELAPLNGFLEPNAVINFGGVKHSRADGVLVFTADNTFGNGDDSGRHTGTRPQNSALIDRFARVIKFEFLPLAMEIEAVTRHTGCTEDLARHVLKAVGVARSKVSTGDIVEAPSLRSVIYFIRALQVLSVREAWTSAVVMRQPSESLSGLDAIYTACIDESFISKNI